MNEVLEIKDENNDWKYKEIVNLTYHTNLKEIESGLTFPPSGQIARVDKTVVTLHKDPRGFSITKTIYGDIIGLDIENLKPDTLYIVSVVVINALQSKGIFLDNVVCPNSIRNSEGQVFAIKGFKTNG